MITDLYVMVSKMSDGSVHFFCENTVGKEYEIDFKVKPSKVFDSMDVVSSFVNNELGLGCYFCVE